MGAIESWVANLIAYYLTDATLSKALGMVLSENTQYRCFPEDPNRVRKPDVSFISQDRMTADMLTGFVRIPPDIAVEIVSPHDGYREVEEKVAEYLAAGVRLVWVINPGQKMVRVHRTSGMPYDVGESEELTGEDVLPEFRLRVGRLFEIPGGPKPGN